MIILGLNIWEKITSKPVSSGRICLQSIADWEETLYIGIALRWDYDKGTVQVSLTGFISTELHCFQHEKPKLPQD